MASPKTRSPFPACSSLRAPPGIANCIRPSASRCSAIIPRRITSASGVPSSCSISTAAIRPPSPRCSASTRASSRPARARRTDFPCGSAATTWSSIRATPFDRPEFFGYSLNLDRGGASEASPAAIGTLAYVAFETRRLYESLRPKPQSFQPLPVTSLVESEDALLSSQREALAHTSGQVFDIDYSGLPPGELECLRFVLDDLGWDGYLGFVEEGSANLHIGCSPSSRDFFTTVYREALEAR